MNGESVEELRKRVEAERRVLEELEAKLRRTERAEWDRIWFPQGFYTAYYVLSGMVLGVIASWLTLILNVAGAPLLGEEPLKLLRVYSTMLGGARTIESAGPVILLFALGVHTLTGAVCGAPIHVVYSRFFMGQGLLKRLFTGLWLGAVMWLVNFYGVISWLQPLLLGEETSYIVQNVPVWVAALTHVAFTEIVLLLQPLAVFNARNYPVPAEAARGAGGG
ncbi:MAG: hypothetical protein HY721_12320 [Planctomycetes bacterium]|nr:hypothetical protein [Planctomycetota bacterium]